MVMIQGNSQPVTDVQVQVVPFTRAELDTFHAFRLTGTCLAGLVPRVDGQLSIALFPKHIWKTIFKYLSPRDLFTVFVTAKEWSVSFDLDLYRNRYCLAETDYNGDMNGRLRGYLSISNHILRPIQYLEYSGNDGLISGQELALVCAKSPHKVNAKEAVLKTIQDFDALQSVSSHVRDHIVYLDIWEASCLQTSLDEILYAFPRLQEFFLSITASNEDHPFNWEEVIFSRGGPLLSLKRATIENGAEKKGMDLFTLQCFFTAVPNIESFSLDRLNYNFEDSVPDYWRGFQLKENSLPLLRRIRIHELNYREFDHASHLIETILKAAPHLEEVDFGFIQNKVPPKGVVITDPDAQRNLLVREDEVSHWIELAMQGIPFAQKRLDSLMQENPQKRFEVKEYLKERHEEAQLMMNQSAALYKRIAQNDEYSAKKQKMDE
ncbi:MAG: hypothetical protein KBF71_05295 [Alphaproteobacteria bacterium]|nr:hypothetical protein [Alphaproteobacteria bacterium]